MFEASFCNFLHSKCVCLKYVSVKRPWGLHELVGMYAACEILSLGNPCYWMAEEWTVTET